MSLPAGVLYTAAEDLADAPLYLPYKALVSTVRSSPKWADHDQHFDLGFVKNEKVCSLTNTPK